MYRCKMRIDPYDGNKIYERVIEYETEIQLAEMIDEIEEEIGIVLGGDSIMD